MRMEKLGKSEHPSLSSILSSSVEWLETCALRLQTFDLCAAHADAESDQDEQHAGPELRDASTQWYPPCPVARTHSFRQQHAWVPPGLHVVPPPEQRKQSTLHQRQVACCCLLCQGCHAHGMRTSPLPPSESCLMGMLTRREGMQHSLRMLGTASRACVCMCRCMPRSAGGGQQCRAVHLHQLRSRVTAVLTGPTPHNRPVSTPEIA